MRLKLMSATELALHGRRFGLRVIVKIRRRVVSLLGCRADDAGTGLQVWYRRLYN